MLHRSTVRSNYGVRSSWGRNPSFLLFSSFGLFPGPKAFEPTLIHMHICMDVLKLIYLDIIYSVRIPLSRQVFGKPAH